MATQFNSKPEAMTTETDIPASRKYFGDTAFRYDERRESKQTFHDDQYVLQQFLNANVRPGSKLLDVACGTNRISPLVRDLGGHYHGIDASSDMVSLARSKDPEADIVIADARKIPHPANNFDVVLAVKFLKWVPDDAALLEILKEISRVLRPGGTALLHQKINVPARQRLIPSLRHALKMVLRPKSARARPGPRTRTIGERGFMDLCAQAGLNFRYSMAIGAISEMTNRPSFSAFYALEKM